MIKERIKRIEFRMTSYISFIGLSEWLLFLLLCFDIFFLQVIRKLCPYVARLAVSRFGSHCVENMYKASIIKVKELIAAELQKNMSVSVEHLILIVWVDGFSLPSPDTCS